MKMLFCQLSKVKNCQFHFGSTQQHLPRRVIVQIKLDNLQKCLCQYLAHNKCPLKDSGDDGDDSGYLTPNIGHRLRPSLDYITNTGPG